MKVDGECRAAKRAEMEGGRAEMEGSTEAEERMAEQENCTVPA